MLHPFANTQTTRQSKAIGPTLPTTSAPAGLLFCERFLQSLLGNDEPAPKAVVDGATSFLRAVYVRHHAIQPPTIGQGDNGLVAMTWAKPKHHITVEFFPDDHVEFFYENLVDRSLVDGVLGTEISLEKALSLVARVA